MLVLLTYYIYIFKLYCFIITSILRTGRPWHINTAQIEEWLQTIQQSVHDLWRDINKLMRPQYAEF